MSQLFEYLNNFYSDYNLLKENFKSYYHDSVIFNMLEFANDLQQIKKIEKSIINSSKTKLQKNY